MEISKEEQKELIRAQQGELDGVETYLRLARTVHNDSDARTFRELASDEGRHASVFKGYTGETLAPSKKQAIAVTILYRLFGKRIVYPIIASGEYAAIPGYEKMMKKFPDVESVKNDEKRHGDTVKALVKNGEFNDVPLLPVIICSIVVITGIFKIFLGDSSH